MKKILSIISLAVLTVGLLCSCSKINERIDDLDKRIYDIENDKIASVEQQITAIKESIADLETIRTNIQTLIEAKTTQGEDITSLTGVYGKDACRKFSTLLSKGWIKALGTDIHRLGSFNHAIALGQTVLQRRGQTLIDLACTEKTVSSHLKSTIPTTKTAS